MSCSNGSCSGFQQACFIWSIPASQPASSLVIVSQQLALPTQMAGSGTGSPGPVQGCCSTTSVTSDAPWQPSPAVRNPSPAGKRMEGGERQWSCESLYDRCLLSSRQPSTFQTSACPAPFPSSPRPSQAPLLTFLYRSSLSMRPFTRTVPDSVPYDCAFPASAFNRLVLPAPAAAAMQVG